MMSDKVNILAVNTDENLTRLINGIFGSIHYQLTSLNSTSFPFQLVAEQLFDLIIIDSQSRPFTPSDIKQIQMLSPNTHLVLIEKDLSGLKHWSEFNQLNVIPALSLAERLPIVLSHFYSQFSNKNAANLNYWRLLKSTLETNGLFTAVLDAQSQIIFLNKIGRQILKISFDEESSLKFYDFMKEGEKVWKFLTGKFHNFKTQDIQMQLQLIDRNFSEFSFPVSVRKIKGEQDYYIVQGTCLTEKTGSPTTETETILNSFADSLANELLNPLNVIWGRLQLFQTNDHLTDQDKHHLQLIEKQIQRINEVITRLVSFTSIKRDLVPQKIILNEIFNRLIYVPSLREYVEKSTPRIELNLGENLPPLYGQIAHFELLFNMIIELILNLTSANSKIIVETLSEITENDGREEVFVNFLIKNYTETADQYLLKNSLQFGESGKKKFALETTIIRFILDEYKIKHQLMENSSSLILSLNFPGS